MEHFIIFFSLNSWKRQHLKYFPGWIRSRKAVHETVNDQHHVVHEGKLRIIIVHNLKVNYSPLNETSGFHNTLILYSRYALQILSLEFCSRDLEELCCLEVQFYLRYIWPAISEQSCSIHPGPCMLFINHYLF